MKVADVGGGNNMANSRIKTVAKLPFHLDLACPEGYDPDRAIMKRRRAGAPAGFVPHGEPAEVIDGPRSFVVEEVENRFHVWKTVMKS